MSKNDASSLGAARAMIAAQEASVRGKVVVITGATAGIGQSAAERLAGLGARIVMVARDRGRADQALARLREIAPNAAHCAYYADLSLLGEVKRVGAEIAVGRASHRRSGQQCRRLFSHPENHGGGDRADLRP
jgi:NADPH:quinone reductase-like Zn-dependent oxidoreductase